MGDAVRGDGEVTDGAVRTGPRLPVAALPREGQLPHVVLAFIESIGMLFRWRIALLLAIPVVILFLLRTPLPPQGSVPGLPAPSFVRGWTLVLALVQGTVLGLVLSLLASVVDERGGADRVLAPARLVAATLAAAVVGGAVLLKDLLDLLYRGVLRLDSDVHGALLGAHWILVAAAVFFAAWELSGRTDEERGALRPGVGTFLFAGTLIYVATVLGPALLQATSSASALNPWDRRAHWYRWIPAARVGTDLLAMFGVLWFFRSLARLRSEA
jgi:hypothetical protein